ncbi:MAG TPA: crosslink repair DNA glycosylase YcaQ family protein [Acidimicrobiia bacterium]|nr:crosslink repair DNA glycosylase YcaQ family protein [Acidimicrobiia bacterium]
MGADLSMNQARRLALASLGFGRRRPAKAGLTHVRATVQRLSAIQIDSVNVLARAHYLPVFSRYGPYPTAVLDDLVHGRRELFEYWGHAACFLPIELYPYLRWRMDTQVTHWGGGEPQQQAFLEAVFAEVAERGPLPAGKIAIGGKSTGAWWGWSDAKRAVEVLFRQGRVAIAGRRNFERWYDIPERVFPPQVLHAKPVPETEAKKALLVRAARAMGVGTARDVAMYFHIDSWWDRSKVDGRRAPAQTHLLFDELVEDGRLERVTVEGWTQPGYVVPGARIPRSIDARAIVSPFDPLMWERRWTKAVFGFDYQIEIYVPAPKRIYGYYVLPFLCGEGFAGRVDLKADRKTSTLLVQAAYVEAGHDPKAVAEPLALELRHIAGWLSLDRINVATRGDLAGPLCRALGSR